MEKKKKHNLKAEISFMWGKMRTIAQVAALQIKKKKNDPKRWAGRVMLVKAEVRATKHTFLQKVATSLVKVTCYSRGANVTVKDFSAFLETRRCKNWAHKISSKYLTI